MKKIILFALLALPIGAGADVKPKEVFGSILELILDNINKDKNGNIDESNKVILKENGNKIVLGRVFLNKDGDVDAFVLPECGPNKKNKFVSNLRLRVAEAGAYIETVKITFQNDKSVTVDVEDGFNKGENSGWFDLPGGNRCIKKIRVIGEAVGGKNAKTTVVTFVGLKSNNIGGGFGPGGNFDIDLF